jgi:hypothetical protein
MRSRPLVMVLVPATLTPLLCTPIIGDAQPIPPGTPAIIAIVV